MKENELNERGEEFNYRMFLEHAFRRDG